jgi:hypothetical protein
MGSARLNLPWAGVCPGFARQRQRRADSAPVGHPQDRVSAQPGAYPRARTKNSSTRLCGLSIRYGIVTPYTSYLVTEPLPLGAESQERIVDEAFKSAADSPSAPSGQAAVERAAQEGAMQSADVVPQAQSNSCGRTAIRVVGARTFLLQEGVWMDTRYDPQAMAVQKLAFLSRRSTTNCWPPAPIWHPRWPLGSRCWWWWRIRLTRWC